MTDKDKKFWLRKAVVYFIVIIVVVLISFVARYFVPEEKVSDTVHFLPEQRSSEGSLPHSEDKKKSEGKDAQQKAVTYTELFSGEGWKDEEKSTVYHDRGTTKLSFPPAYEWSENEELTSYAEGLELADIASNGETAVLATADGKLHAFQEDAAPVSADSGVAVYPGDTVLEYEPDNDKWILASFGDNRIRVGTFDIGDGDIRKRQGQRSSPVFLRETRWGNKSVGLSCLRGECLLRVDSRFYHFPSDNINLFSHIDPSIDLPSVHEITVEEAGEFWAMGVTGRDGEEFVSDLYLLYPENLPISERRGMEEADCEFVERNNEERIIPADKNSDPFSSGEGNDICRTIKPAFVSQYAGKMDFAFDKKNSELLAAYLAYRGKAFKFEAGSDGLLPRPRDHSFYFNQRMTKEHNVGKIFYHGPALWISSVADPSSFVFEEEVDTGFFGDKRKLFRVESGMQAELTGEIPDRAGYFELIKGLGPDHALGVAAETSEEEGAVTDLRFYDLDNKGYDLEADSVEWVSNQINRNTGGEAVAAEITDMRGEENDGEIKFYFSADGGENWIPAEPGEEVDLEKAPHKHLEDFRWKAELIAGEDNHSTPWLGMVQLRYTVR